MSTARLESASRIVSAPVTGQPNPARNIVTPHPTRRSEVILVIGRVSCGPEDRERLVAICERMQEASRREVGCIRYGFFAAVEDSHSFVAVEEWADRGALDRHFAQPHLLEFSRDLVELVSERPEVAIHEIASTSAFPGG